MRVLYITFENPSKYYGGGRALIQSLESLSVFCEIDYVGLPFDREEFPTFNIKNTFFLEKKKNLMKGFINLFRGVPTFSYASWKKIRNQLNAEEYDFAFIEFSHTDFAVKWAKEHKLKTVVRAHNIEYDIVTSIAKAKKIDRKKIRASINKRAIFKRENRSFDMADSLIFLTENDKTRASLLYNKYLDDKSKIIPICMPVDKEKEYNKVFDFEYILATGSLNYGANVEGISWFINEVWKPYAGAKKNGKYKLVVAGSNPSGDFIKLCEETDCCELVNTPPDIAPYLENAKFYVAPIFVGAGMKVKVSEALMHGLKVVGTDHAFIGYDKAEKFLYRANSPEEFTKQIDLLLNEEVRKSDKEECINIFNAEFSMNVSKEKYKNAVTDLLQN